MSLLPRVGLLVATLMVILGIGEIGARVRATRRAPPAPAHAVEPNDRDLPILEGVFDIARKNVRGQLHGVFFRTNAHGIRGPDYTREPDADVFRILIVGDSVTMGWGVAEEHAYPAVLERMLNAEAAAGRRYEVLNAGLAGVNADFSMRRIGKLARVYRPDLTIYGFTVNDIQGPRYRRFPVSAEPAPAPRRDLYRFRDSPSYLLREMWPRWVGLRHRGARDFVAETLTANYFENPDAFGDFVAALARHADYARQNGTCGHVLIHTFLANLSDEHPYRRIYGRVAEVSRSYGLSVTDSYPFFAGYDASELHVAIGDSHPNWKGHEILATALLAGLRELPKACWRTAAERRGVARDAGRQKRRGHIAVPFGPPSSWARHRRSG